MVSGGGWELGDVVCRQNVASAKVKPKCEVPALTREIVRNDDFPWHGKNIGIVSIDLTLTSLPNNQSTNPRPILSQLIEYPSSPDSLPSTPDAPLQPSS